MSIYDNGRRNSAKKVNNIINLINYMVINMFMQDMQYAGDRSANASSGSIYYFQIYII